jgi:hypothetical protein
MENFMDSKWCDERDNHGEADLDKTTKQAFKQATPQ